ncbi:hypothetical protein JCM10207_007638 [Rhodosporidiobolus poonsookiae]
MFRATAQRLAGAVGSINKAAPSIRSKLSTGITGLAVHPEPLPALLHTYNSTLALVQQMPASAVYRQSVESITRERLDAVNSLGGEGSEQEIEAVESKIGHGIVEELLLQAEEELKLAGKMIEWKSWEELEEVPAPGQWEQFRVTPSTTTADDLHPN